MCVGWQGLANKFINSPQFSGINEEKFPSVEKERANALEVATQADEEGKATPRPDVISPVSPVMHSFECGCNVCWVVGLAEEFDHCCGSVYCVGSYHFW